MPQRPLDITIELDLRAFQARIANAPTLLAGAKTRLLTAWAISVEAEAKTRAPVDTGRLRASLTHEVLAESASAGTNVVYAPFVEFGTRPHFPPLGAIAGWAGHHGMSAGALAWAIAKHGTKPHPYLIPAFQTVNANVLPGLVAALGRELGTP